MSQLVRIVGTRWWLAGLIALLVGCGGGSGSGDFDSPVPLGGSTTPTISVSVSSSGTGDTLLMTEVLTVNITANTAITAPTVLIGALLLSFDLDEAIEVSREIETFRNTYEEESDEEGGTTNTSSETTDEETAPPFNVYKSLADLREINEEWVDDSGVEDSIYTLIEKDLKNISVFRSTFFKALLQGEREDQVVEGVMVVKRGADKIEVISWRETAR